MVTESAPVSVGLLTPDARGQSIAVAPAPAVTGRVVALAVTLEPAGGVPAPTGRRSSWASSDIPPRRHTACLVTAVGIRSRVCRPSDVRGIRSSRHMSNASSNPEPSEVFPRGSGTPAYQPRERFWPYAALPEQPTPEELAALDPDLHAALFGAPPRPFSFTLTFPPFEAPDYDRAVALARASAEYRETGSGDSFRHRARFYPQDAGALKDLFEIIGRYDAAEVLVDDRPVPFARELWLPLLWILTLRVPV